MTVLYITYDGLLDPLGPSQILPYIKDISKHQEEVVVVSFEKSEQLLKGKDVLLSDLQNYPIEWKPLLFTKGLGILGKLLDLSRMYLTAFIIVCKHNVRVVHTRSHPPAQAGLFVKRITKAKFIFDFRGLWVDERVDKGSWDLNRFFHRLQYKYYKRTERKLLAQSDHVVVLTNKVVNEVMRLGSIEKSRITVIPCCADYKHFPLATNTHKKEARISLGIPSDAFVLGYLGSIGKMYLLDRFFRLFKLAVNVRKDCHALLITRDTAALKQLIESYLTPDLSDRIHVRSASRDEVPVVLPSIDVMVSFIFSTYARQGSSPTKMAESFAMGIPVIANPGVGDVKRVVDHIDGGYLVDPSSDANLMEVVQNLDKIYSKGGIRLRDVSRPILGLEYASQSYKSVYDKLL